MVPAHLTNGGEHMNIGRPLLVFAAVIMGMLSSGAGLAKPLSRDIAQTPHNLSASGGGGAHDIKSATETRICVFCHTPIMPPPSPRCGAARFPP